jgi:hypothetical protein
VGDPPWGTAPVPDDDAVVDDVQERHRWAGNYGLRVALPDYEMRQTKRLRVRDSHGPGALAQRGGGVISLATDHETNTAGPSRVVRTETPTRPVRGQDEVCQLPPPSMSLSIENRLLRPCGLDPRSHSSS